MNHVLGLAWLVSVVLAAGCQSQASRLTEPLRIALVSDTHTTRGTKDDQPKYRGRLVSFMGFAWGKQGAGDFLPAARFRLAK